MSLPLPLRIWILVTFIATLLLASDVLSKIQNDSMIKRFNQTTKNAQLVSEATLPNGSTTLENSHDTHFDFLMFTQLWPISNCIDWKEREDDHTCILNRKFKIYYIDVKI